VRIHFRACDDGIAFRYALDGSGVVTIAGESSGFRLPAGGSVTYWGQNHPNNHGYETMLGRIEGERMSMPVLVELKDVKHFLFVAQAACAWRITDSDGPEGRPGPLPRTRVSPTFPA
jgi:hypothetical protein